MKKNFIKVSVFCALMAATSAGVVSCSDYDDDIKNHQEQIDALKKQLDASKSEITTALQTAIEGLEAEIAEVAGEANANSEAVNNLKQTAEALQNAIDQKAGKDEIEGLSNAVQEQIDKVNAELAAAMEGVKEELNGKVADLTAKQEELSKKLEELMGAGGDTESIKAQLDQVAADLAEAMNQLKTIQDAKYGEQIAGLAADIAELKGLEEKVNGYTDEEIKKLDVALTAKITAAVDDVMTKVEDKYRPELDALSQKFADYATKNDMDTVVAFLGGLENLKGQTLEGLLNGKANAEDLTNLSNKVDGLIEEAIKEGGVITTAIKEEADAVRAEFDKIMGLMIQSFMYLPEYDENTLQAKNLAFSALDLKNSDGTFARVAENVDGVVKFRVSPASAVAAFKEGKYAVTFEGNKIITRSKLVNYLDAEYLENATLEEQGIVSFKVKKTNDFVANSAYALCAHVVPVTEEGAEENATKDYTDVTSDFFVADHTIIKVDEIVAHIDTNVDGSVADTKQTFVWDGSNGESYDLSKGRKLIGKLGGVEQCNSLAEKFPSDIFNITYELVYGSGESRRPFAIDAQTGVVTLGRNQSGDLGVKATAKATVEVASHKYVTNYTTREFEVIKAILTCNYEAQTILWTNVATGSYTITLNKTTVANAFKMGIADLEQMLSTATKTDNANVVLANASGVSQGRVVVTGSGDIEIHINQHADIVGGELVVDFKDGSATTTTASEYQLRVNISPVQYPGAADLKLKHVNAIWGENNTVILTPRVNTAEVTKKNGTKVNVVSGVTLATDVRAFYENFADIETNNVKANHAKIYINTVGVNGVPAANYVTDGAANQPEIEVTPNAYQGQAIKGTTKVIFDDGRTEWLKPAEEFTVQLLQLSGTIKAPETAAGQITFSKKSEELTVEGFTWNDYIGRAIFKDGVVQVFKQGVLEDAQFASDPFVMYAMNQPTYSLSETGNEAILKVDPTTGKVSFTDYGKGLAIQNEHRVKLYITVKQPRWGAIKFEGVTPKFNEQTKTYTYEYDVVVPTTVANN
jgi:uncharacterized coiled-coil DUF342 family protein